MFCGTHLKAPPAQRGGWLSAERRRRSMNNDVHAPLDANCVAKRLWVGSVPPFDRDLPGFDVLALCARELQPATLAFHGHVLRCPIPDDTLSSAQVNLALITGCRVAAHLAAGKRVLVTCQAGINRSALVAAIGIGTLTRMSADHIVSMIRTRRSPNCLCNPHFQQILKTYIGNGRERRAR